MVAQIGSGTAECEPPKVLHGLSSRQRRFARTISADVPELRKIEKAVEAVYAQIGIERWRN